MKETGEAKVRAPSLKKTPPPYLLVPMLLEKVISLPEKVKVAAGFTSKRNLDIVAFTDAETNIFKPSVTVRVICCAQDKSAETVKVPFVGTVSHANSDASTPGRGSAAKNSSAARNQALKLNR